MQRLLHQIALDETLFEFFYRVIGTNGVNFVYHRKSRMEAIVAKRDRSLSLTEVLFSWNYTTV